MDRIPKSGEFYRHFKDKLYQIIAVAEHSETREAMVVYQALYGDYRIYVRPLTMFVSEVDHNKYPQVVQKNRFEHVMLSSTGKPEETIKATQPEPMPDADLMAFIEAETYDQRLECLYLMKESISSKEVNSICAVLDMDEIPGTIEERIDIIEQYLLMQKRYEGSRLR